MSLVAVLLGVPGKLRRLRGHNAPVRQTLTPMGPHYVFLSDGGPASWHPPLWTHAVEALQAPNNAAVVKTEVCSLTGPGAVDAVWLKTRANGIATNTLVSYGLEVLVDGVDLMPGDWRHEHNPFRERSHLYSAAIGGVHPTYQYVGASGGYSNPNFVRASVPIPFDQSLVVNVVHYETESTLLFTDCWVNAWNTA
jgi:hypothetical protein